MKVSYNEYDFYMHLCDIFMPYFLSGKKKESDIIMSYQAFHFCQPVMSCANPTLRTTPFNPQFPKLDNHNFADPFCIHVFVLLWRTIRWLVH